jgi:glycosyltransferase involved in cell wall biosynthesis
MKQSHKNIEIILIDDGSKDDSLKVCRKYEKKDSRIKVIAKKNSGVSATRNLGIEQAAGKYIAFVDCDDWVSKNYVENLVKKAEQCSADCAVSAITDVYFRDIKNRLQCDTFSRGDNEQLSLFLLDKKMFGFSCGKLFKTSIIKENGLAFKLDMPIYEDCLFTLQYLQYCNTITTANAVYYYNHLTSNSAVSKFYPLAHVYRVDTLIEFKKFILAFCCDEQLQKHFVLNYMAYIFYRTTEQYVNPLREDCSQGLKEVYQAFLPWFTEYLKGDNVIQEEVYYERIQICEKISLGAYDEQELLRPYTKDRRENKIKVAFKKLLKKVKYFFAYYLFK